MENSTFAGELSGSNIVSSSFDLVEQEKSIEDGKVTHLVFCPRVGKIAAYANREAAEKFIRLRHKEYPDEKNYLFELKKFKY